MTVVLVTGNPGSGKTALAEELARRGVRAMDTDALAHWESIDGTPAERPSDASDEWHRDHRWVWSRALIERFIGQHEESLVVLCGIAMNQRDMFDLFDMVVLLSIDDDTQIARLDASGNRNQAARAEVIAGRPYLERETSAAGALVLDGCRPTAQIADRVLREAKAHARRKPEPVRDDPGSSEHP